MTLLPHFEQENWEALEVAWTESMLAGDPVEPALELLDHAASRKLVARFVPLVRDHAGALIGAGRHADAAELLGRAMLGGGSPGELAEELVRAAEAAWSTEPWWPAYSEISGLRAGVQDARGAWRAFRKLQSLRPEAVVFHASGWGLGQVQTLDAVALEVAVKFRTGRTDRFPLRTAVAIFDVLDPDDLRALLVRDEAGLRKLMRDDPLDALERMLRRYNGRANHTVLRSAFAQLDMDGTAFTSWWRRARKLAETSPWFEVTGQASKAQVRLLAAATDPVQSLCRQLRMAPSLAAALSRVRDLSSGTSIAPELREAAMSTLESLAAADDAPLPERLQAWLFLRDERGTSPEPLAERMRRAAAATPTGESSELSPLWRLFHLVPGLREQERCLEILRELRGDDAWLDDLEANLPNAPPGMIRAGLEALRAGGREAALVRSYAGMLARPLRNPHLLIGLAETFEPDRASADLPGPVQRAQAFLHLARYLFEESPGDALLTRARARLSELLCEGEPPLLARLLGAAERSELKTLRALTERGIDEAIETALTDVIAEKAPEIFREEEKPFWETGGLWTTRAGLARRQADLRELKEVKLAANSEAIGRAASYGDLSENSEWVAAIEEQRTLTQRAMELENELRSVRLLEHASLPPATAAPGTAVRIRELATGADREIWILGPWDLGDENVVSYRAPLAAGLLGHHPGERVRIELPGGSTELEILSVETLRLSALSPAASRA